jgi:hypothetical protein
MAGSSFFLDLRGFFDHLFYVNYRSPDVFTDTPGIRVLMC